MKRKIENYLNSKDKNEYSNLDRIFELYLSGDIKKLLSKVHKRAEGEYEPCRKTEAGEAISEERNEQSGGKA